MREDRLGLREFVGGGVEALDGGAEEFVEAAKGFGVEGVADRAEGDVKCAAVAFGHMTEIFLDGQEAFGSTHGTLTLGFGHGGETLLQIICNKNIRQA